MDTDPTPTTRGARAPFISEAVRLPACAALGLPERTVYRVRFDGEAVGWARSADVSKLNEAWRATMRRREAA